MKINEAFFDIETGEETVVERELTAEEVKKYKAAEAERLEVIKQHQKALAAKSVILEKLGITEDEAKLLLS
jgi:hypothetical protein